MLWNIKVENLISGDFVEFITDRDGKLSCKKALELASISAIAARDIAEGEMLTFDTNGDTKDLTTPQNPISRPWNDRLFVRTSSFFDTGIFTGST